MTGRRQVSKEYKQRVELAVKQLFDKASAFQDLTQANVASIAGVSEGIVNKALDKDQWSKLKDKWELARLCKAMDQVYQEANIRHDFAVEKIIRIVGITRGKFMRLAGSEWHTRRATLPTPQEKVLRTLEELLEANIPLVEMTRERVISTANVYVANDSRWFSRAFRATYRKLAKLQDTTNVPPDGVQARIIPGGWIDLDSDNWDLRKARHLRRNRLRGDLADIAWSILREELHIGELALGSVVSHYDEFILAGKVLGSEVPDVRKASLEGVQRSWLNFVGTDRQKTRARAGMARLFVNMLDPIKNELNINTSEIVKITVWLNAIDINSQSRKGDFFSEGELNLLMEACLNDIRDGLDFAEANPDLLYLSTKWHGRDSAMPIIHWGTALMILVATFTGLRRQSIMLLRVGDWIEMRPGLFALAWRHGKNKEENLAVLPASVGHLLDIYVRYTNQVRMALDSDLLFLHGDNHGCWGLSNNSSIANSRLADFAKRHELLRSEATIDLTFTTLRRTYVTRELYEGRSIWTIRLQLGHKSISTTLGYAQFDRYEHPRQVSTALDNYGRISLVTWHKPLLLEDLDPKERKRHLGYRTERFQDVGQCSQNSCLKAAESSPPPCLQCEILPHLWHRPGGCGSGPDQ